MTCEVFQAQSVEIDVVENTIRLNLATERAMPSVGRAPAATAVIDVGAQGRLIGVELPGGYVEVMPPDADTESMVRSIEAEVSVEIACSGEAIRTIVIPRQGDGYEITYPSGNR